VSVESTLSGDFILINVVSTFEPRTKEVWVKDARREEGKFWLV